MLSDILQEDVYSLTRTVAPEIMPVTMDEVKRACDLDGVTDFDIEEELDGLLKDAVDAVERDSRRALLTQTFELKIDTFPTEIELRRPPIASVTSVKYVDVNGDLQTMSSADYETDLTGEPGRIRPAVNTTWPDIGFEMNSVRVVFVAGWTSALLVPRSARNAVLLAVNSMYRGCALSDAYWSMISRLRWGGQVL